VPVPVRRLRGVGPAALEMSPHRWSPRGGQPWTVAEERIASRDDLTDEEVAEITGRTAAAVTRRRKTLTIDLPDINAWTLFA